VASRGRTRKIERIEGNMAKDGSGEEMAV